MAKQKTFEVFSSNGLFTVALTGEVLKLDQEPEGYDMSDHIHFDVSEYQATYGAAPAEGDHLDILDLGLTRLIDKEPLYVKPAADWRSQCKHLQRTHHVIM